MNTAQINGENIIIKETESPALDNRRGAIVKVLGCGLCGSDIVKFKYKISKDGTVPGHEIVGIIEKINSNTNFKPGDKIVTSHHIPCFDCIYCRHGNYSMCSHFKETNIIPGGFSEKVFVSEEHLKNVAYRVPDSISNEEISFYEPLGCCVRAVKRAGLQKEDKVLVIGLGSIGLIMCEALKASGYNVSGCDLIDERINFALEKGILAYNSKKSEGFDKIIKEKTGDTGVDAVFMTSGADKAIETALKSIRRGGKILVFSSTPQNFGYQNNEIYYKELTVLGSYSPSPADLKTAFSMLVSGKVNVKGFTTVYPLKNIQQAFDDTIANKVLKAYIKIPE